MSGDRGLPTIEDIQAELAPLERALTTVERWSREPEWAWECALERLGPEDHRERFLPALGALRRSVDEELEQMGEAEEPDDHVLAVASARAWGRLDDELRTSIIYMADELRAVEERQALHAWKDCEQAEAVTAFLAFSPETRKHVYRADLAADDRRFSGKLVLALRHFKGK